MQLQTKQETSDPPSQPQATTGDRYAGWFRRRGQRWRKLVTGPTYDATWGALLSEIGSERGGDSVVVEGHVDPNVGASGRIKEVCR